MKMLLLSLALVVASVVIETPVLSQTVDDASTTPAPVPKNATYWVTLSNQIRPGHPLELTVQILSGSDPVTVTVTITYQSYEVNSTVKTLLTSAPTTVLPGVAQTIQTDIPLNLIANDNDGYGYYKVIVVGQGQTVNFKHEDYISLQTKSFSIFVVTDKAIYKPGQAVKFRVLAIQPATLQAFTAPMDIFILDSKGNRILQYLGIQGKNTAGVVQESFKLADSTPVGDWTINVVTQGQKQQKTFTVDDYKLPTYSVEVLPPSIPLASGPPMTITIKAKYTFGQPVTDGQVDARVSVYQSWIPFGDERKKQEDFRISGKLNSDGEFSFQIGAKQLMALIMSMYSYSLDLSYQQFQVEANVTESSTKRVQTGSTTMQIYPFPLKAQFLPISSAHFKPGLSYSLYLEVKKADDTSLSPQEASKVKVRFNVTYEVPLSQEEKEALGVEQNRASSNDSSSMGKVQSHVSNRFWGPMTKTMILDLPTPVQNLPETGFIPLIFSVPEEASSVNTVAMLDGSSDNAAYHYGTKSESPSDSFIQLSAPTKTPKVGDTITLKLISTETVQKFTYQVYSKSMLVYTDTVTSAAPEGTRSLEFNLQVTQAMTPSIKIVAFYIRKDNSEFVADALSLSTDGLFQKPVSMVFSSDKVKPGEPLNITIRAEPGSTVFVAANDKSVELVKSGNDLTQDTVRSELAEYDFGYNPSWSRYFFICGWPSSSSGSDAASVFQENGIVVFTDGYVYRKQYDYGSMPMAMEDKAMGGVSPVPSSARATAEPRVRKNFPENWIWDVVIVPSDSNGEVVVPVIAPDTITSWPTTIFSLHSTYGLSVGSRPVAVTTFRDMFVSLDLPTSIVRNESFCFTASVFSYYPQPLYIMLTFASSKNYNNVYAKRDGDTVAVSSENLACSDLYPDVSPNEVKSSKFCFTPLVTGDIPIKVTAITNIEGLNDAVEQIINVKAEGVARSNNYPTLINLTNAFDQKEVRINFPPETVDDSQKITVSLTGNLMGSIFENVADLLKQPYGCGEQNMLNLAPSMFLVRFFLATGTMTPEILERASGYILSGCQTELTYEHGTTGGFSAFGDSDSSPSLWLTSFVLKTFAQLASLITEYNINIAIYINDVVARSAQYIISNQNENGSFTEYGVVFHKDMQGGSAEGVSLAAYSLIALAEASAVLKGNSTAANEIQQRMNLAAGYLAGRIPYLTDAYDICITSYALNLVNHASKDVIFEKMEQIAINGDGLKHWQRPQSAQADDIRYAWSVPTSSMSTEMTAYALLTYCQRGIETTQGLPVIRWLTNQRGPNGGFISTQDTVTGLQALTCVSIKLFSTEDIPLTVTVSYIDGDGRSQSSVVKISKATEMLLQRVYIPYKNNAPSLLTITANTDNGQKGPSTVFADVALDYNVKGETRAKYFEMSHVLSTLDIGLELTITVVSLTETATSMSTLTVEVPAGFTIDEEQVAENRNVSRVDPFNGDSVVIYFDSGVIDRQGISVDIIMYTTGDTLTKAQPRSYTIIDYYQPSSEQTKTYIWDIPPYCKAVPDSGICQYVKECCCTSITRLISRIIFSTRFCFNLNRTIRSGFINFFGVPLRKLVCLPSNALL